MGHFCHYKVFQKANFPSPFFGQNFSRAIAYSSQKQSSADWRWTEQDKSILETIAMDLKKDGVVSEVSWSRITIEAIYYYHSTFENFRLGWGATYHINGSVSGKGSNETASASVEKAWGFVEPDDDRTSVLNFFS